MVLDAYEADPWGFLVRALSQRGWVEEMSGLAEVQRRAEEVEVEWESEEEGEGGAGLDEEGELL